MHLRRSAVSGVATLTLVLGAAVSPVGAHDVVNAPVNLVDVRQAMPAGVVARVGTVPLTQDHVERWRLIASATSGPPPNMRERVALRGQAMQFLLLELWVRLEAREHGIGVTRAEAARAFALAKRQTFPSDRDFRDFLRTSNMTEADARFQVRFNELYAKLSRHVINRAKTDDGMALLAERFDRALRRKWRSRTACHERYRSTDCGHIVRTDPLPAPP